MKKRVFLLSVLYSVGQITLGLLVHPYQTMQSLVRDKVFIWMTLLPSVSLALVTLVWKWLVVPFVKLAFSCSDVLLGGCEFLPFFAMWLTFFYLYWQILLLYLLFRFENAFGVR